MTETMNHDQAVSSQAAERYVLGELTPTEREAFEGHYFDCAACFEQVEAGAQFLGRAREVLDREPEPGWFGAMLRDLRRPAPVFVSAMLLCAVGIGIHQQSVISDAREPHVEAHYFVPDDPRGAAKVLTVARNATLSLDINVKPGSQYTSYRADVRTAAGKTKSSRPLPIKPSDDSVTLGLTASILDPGTYSVVINGVAADGSVTKVGGGSFELRFAE
jgi:Putative zinc-finger